MPLQYLHGIETLEVPDGIRPIQTVRSAVIGIIGTAELADVTRFPLNEPVLLTSPHDVVSLGATGSLPDALNNMFKVARATILVVRVAAGVDAAATIGNMIGSAVAFTGVHAFRKARAKFGFGPRLLVAPGFTTQMPTNGLLSVTVGTGGTGYNAATSVVTISGGGGTGARARPVINAGGQITAIIVEQPGQGYTTVPTVTVSGGTGATLTAVPGAVMNPVAVELAAVAPNMRAYAFVNSPSTNYAAAVAYRQKLASDRVMVLEGNAQVTDPSTGLPVTMPSSTFAAIMQAVTDENFGFWYSFSNQPVPGIVGVDRPIEWAFTNGNVEGQLLNSQGISVLVQDEGFRFMGVRSAISTGVWQFMSVRRTADMVYDSIENALRDAVDKPISVGLLDWVEGSVNAYLRILQRRGAIIGGRAWLDRELNSPADLVSGHVTFDFDIEPPAPLERLTFRAHRNADYYTELVESYLQTA